MAYDETAACDSLGASSALNSAKPAPSPAASRTEMVSETHLKHDGDLPIRDLLNRVRHDGCGGRAGSAELLTALH
jgi:hypothetical protein